MTSKVTHRPPTTTATDPGTCSRLQHRDITVSKSHPMRPKRNMLRATSARSELIPVTIFRPSSPTTPSAPASRRRRRPRRTRWKTNFLQLVALPVLHFSPYHPSATNIILDCIELKWDFSLFQSSREPRPEAAQPSRWSSHPLPYGEQTGHATSWNHFVVPARTFSTRKIVTLIA